MPPYSPDLMPIEEMFSKIKGFLRSAAARTTEAVYEAMGAALRTVCPEDIRGWFKWTRLSCRRFKDNQVRLQLFALAYNLGNSCGSWRCRVR